MGKKVHYNKLLSLKNVSVFLIGILSIGLFFYALNSRNKSILSNSVTNGSSEVKSLLDFVKLDAQSSNGIYYYRGTNVNNNILFADKCWQIVRTTENGGAKLIYNGDPVNGTCNTTTNYIGSSPYNNNANKVTSVGYMYGDYDYSSINFYTETQAGSFFGGGTGMTYIYGKDAILNADGTYTLTNAQSFNAMGMAGLTMGNTHKYTCFAVDTNKEYKGTTDYHCGDVVYITAYRFVSTSNGTAYYVSLPNTVSYYQSEYPSLLHGFSTSSLYNTNYTATWAFATDATYNSSTGDYTLSGTVTSYDMGNWSDDHSAVDNSHFTCFRVNGVSCENLYYVIYSGEGGLYFFRIKSQADLTSYKNGTYLNYILQDNTNNSSVKSVVDNWYATNIVGSEDEEYIIDDVYYNDRATADYGGWVATNPTTRLSYFQAYNRGTFNLSLNDIYDSFSVSSSNAKLTYPVGILSYDEAMMSGVSRSSSSYLGTNAFWLSTPHSFVEYKEADNTGDGTYYYEMRASVYSVSSTGFLSSSYVDTTNYVRPVISVDYEMPVTGSGTPDDPYHLVESYSVTYSFSGDYPDVTLPTGGNYAEGSEVVVNTSIAVGQKVNGYVFNGWTSSDVTISNGKFTMPAKNVSLVGTWNKLVLPELTIEPEFEDNNSLGRIYYYVNVSNPYDFKLENVKIQIANSACYWPTECKYEDDIYTYYELDPNSSFTLSTYVDSSVPGTYTASVKVVGVSGENLAFDADNATLVSASASTVASLKVCSYVTGGSNGSVAQFELYGSNMLLNGDYPYVYTLPHFSSDFVVKDNNCVEYFLGTNYRYYILQRERMEYSFDFVSGLIDEDEEYFILEPKSYVINYYYNYENKKYFHNWDRKENDIEFFYPV